MVTGLMSLGMVPGLISLGLVPGLISLGMVPGLMSLGMVPDLMSGREVRSQVRCPGGGVSNDTFDITYPLPPVDSQAPVKTLPSRNVVYGR